MGFTDRPVSELGKLHGKEHKEAVRKLKDNVDKGKFTALLGPRRVGKTSVLRTFLNHYKYQYLYYDLSPYIGLTGVSYRSITPVLIGFNTKKLSAEGQLNLGMLKMRFKVEHGMEFENAFINLLRELNERYKRFLLVFDEAQVLAFVRGINMLGIFQMIHNALDNVVVIMTGSMPGLLEKMLSPSSTSPMFARYVERIHIHRWSKKEGVEYLRKGVEERNIEYSDEELEEAAEELSGVPGFLAIYGVLRLNGSSHGEALKNAFEHAVSLWENDLDAFLNIYTSRTYPRVLFILAQSKFGFTWSELMRELSRFENVSKPKLSRILNNLIGAGMVEKRNGKYFIAERPLAYAALRFRF